MQNGNNENRSLECFWTKQTEGKLLREQEELLLSYPTALCTEFKLVSASALLFRKVSNHLRRAGSKSCGKKGTFFFSQEVFNVLQRDPSSIEILLPFSVPLFEENFVCYFTAMLENYLLTLKHIY